MDNELEWCAKRLEQSSDYRVLRSLRPRRVLHPRNGADVRNGLFVDVETTGLDSTRDEAVQLAMVPFRFGRDGTIYDIDTPLNELQEPSVPISPKTETINGLTQASLKGRQFNVERISKCVDRCDVVVSHNAAFDRPFVEKVCDAFAGRPWGCSMVDIDWGREGLESHKLSFLAMKNGFFYPEHDAVFDCLAALELLSTPLPTGSVPFFQVMRAATMSKVRIHAEETPYGARSLLKQRGYRWIPTPQRTKSAWWLDVDDEKLPDEIRLLQNSVYGTSRLPLLKRVGGLERFSVRAH